MNRGWLNLTGFLALTLLAVFVSCRARAETVQLTGAPFTFSSAGEVSHQQVGDKVLWFDVSTGHVFLTIEHCPNATFERKSGVWSYACH